MCSDAASNDRAAHSGAERAAELTKARDRDGAWLHLDAPDCVRTLRLAWRQDGYLSMAAGRFRDLALQTLTARPSSGAAS